VTWLPAASVLKAALEAGILLDRENATRIGRGVTRGAVNVVSYYRSRDVIKLPARAKNCQRRESALAEFLAAFEFDVVDIDGRRTPFASNFCPGSHLILGIRHESVITELFNNLQRNLESERLDLDRERENFLTARREVGVAQPECRVEILFAFRALPDTLQIQAFAALAIVELRDVIKKNQKAAASSDAKENLAYLLQTINGIDSKDKQSFKTAWRLMRQKPCKNEIMTCD
jgi:hypothetical protein